MAKQEFNAFDGEHIHVCARMCKTCIYRKDSPVYDTPIKREAVENETAVICHSTLDAEQQLVCRGFYEHTPTFPLQLAQALDMIKFEEVIYCD